MKKKYDDYELDIIGENDIERPLDDNKEKIINIYILALTSDQREIIYERFKILYMGLNSWGHQLSECDWDKLYESCLLKTINNWLIGINENDHLIRKRYLLKFIPLFPVECMLNIIEKMKEKNIYNKNDSLLYEYKLEETMIDFWKEINNKEGYYVF
jgi:hypothetical protein